MSPVAILRPRPTSFPRQSRTVGPSIPFPLGQDSGGSGAAHYIHSGGAKFIWDEKELVTRLLCPP